MGKLKGKNLEFFAKHIEKYHSAWATQIYFCFDTKKNGETAFSILKSTYGSDINYTAQGVDYRDFYLGFTSGGVRTWVLGDIQSSVAEYRLAHQEEPEDPADPTAGEPSNTETLEEASTDWTTYIIIGLAAVAILLLLFGKKKKG